MENNSFQSTSSFSFVPILPANTNRPRNISTVPLEKPPAFMDTVKEMRGRLVLRQQNSTIDQKSLLKDWRADNKRVYGNKIVSTLHYII